MRWPLHTTQPGTWYSPELSAQLFFSRSDQTSEADRNQLINLSELSHQDHHCCSLSFAIPMFGTPGGSVEGGGWVFIMAKVGVCLGGRHVANAGLSGARWADVC